MSKGSRQRPVDRDRFNDGFDRIFGQVKMVEFECLQCGKKSEIEPASKSKPICILLCDSCRP